MANDMWMVQAVIQPFKLDAVTLALEELPGFGGITITDCRGFGKEKRADLEEAAKGEDPQLRRRREDASLVDFTAKLRLEIAVAGRDQADAIVETISKSAHTGRRGDGKIFVWQLARAVRVRTFDEGERAL